MNSALLKALTFVSLALLSTTAIPDRYIDQSFREPTGGAGPNIGLGLFLLAGVMFLCFAIKDIRTYGYIVGSVLLVLGLAGASEYFILAVPIVLACLAGTAMERKIASDAHTDPHLKADIAAANSRVDLSSSRSSLRKANSLRSARDEAQRDVRRVEDSSVWREIDRRPNKQSDTDVSKYDSSKWRGREAPHSHTNRPLKPKPNGLRDERLADPPRTSARAIREIDRRPNKQGYTGIWNHDSSASRAQTKPCGSCTQKPQPKAHNIRHDPADATQVGQKTFCAPVIIERPSPAIGEDKLIEDVGLTTSDGDFIAILDKFSWLPHARTTRVPIEVPTTKPITVTFARRKSAFASDFTTLGTFLLSGFSPLDGASTNTLEICVSAIEAGLHFQVRDEAGSNLTIKRQ